MSASCFFFFFPVFCFLLLCYLVVVNRGQLLVLTMVGHHKGAGAFSKVSCVSVFTLFCHVAASWSSTAVYGYLVYKFISAVHEHPVGELAHMLM